MNADDLKTLCQVIPDGPDATAQRLRRVADIIEAVPEQHDQESWCVVDQEDNPEAYEAYAEVFDHNYRFGQVVAGDYGVQADLNLSQEVRCGTTRCAAGWACVVTPAPTLQDLDSYESAGAKAFGLHPAAAHTLFYIRENEAIPYILRGLADLPEGRRDRWAVVYLLEAWDEENL